jgi:NADH-quinone oxidoreductase subunit L
MTVPLWILATLALVGGLIGLPEIIQEHNWLDSSLKSSLAINNNIHIAHSTEWVLLAVSSVVAVSGLLLAYRIYAQNTNEKQAGWRSLLEKKYYLDEIYTTVVLKPFKFISEKLLPVFDKNIVDGVINGTGTLMMSLGQAMRSWQSGVAQNYALVITIGLILILTYVTFR